MPPLPLVYANSLGTDPHILALIAAFSQDPPLPGTEPTSVITPLIRHRRPPPSLPGARHIITISDSDSDDEIPHSPPLKSKSPKVAHIVASDLQSDDSESQHRSTDEAEHRAKMEERRAGKKPEASGSVASPRQVSFGDLDLDAIMARICLDDDDNGESSFPFWCAN